MNDCKEKIKLILSVKVISLRLMSRNVSNQHFLIKQYYMLGVHLSSYGSMWEVRRALREAFQWQKRKKNKLNASLASRVLSQLPKCTHNLTDAQLKHGPLLLEYCQFKRKLIEHRILLNHAEHFDWLNANT